MTVWVTRINGSAGHGAGFKANMDFANFAIEAGALPLDYFRLPDDVVESEAQDLRLSARLDGITSGIRGGDTVVIQFPMWTGGSYQTHFINRVKSRGVKLVFLIHDLMSVMLGDHVRDYTNDGDFLELAKADLIMTHSKKMSDFLRTYSDLEAEMFPIGLFDYSTDQPINDASYEQTVIYAGSVNKLAQLPNWPFQTKLEIYGYLNGDFNESNFPATVEYKGARDPDDLIKEINHGFLLVWGDDETFKDDIDNWKFPIMARRYNTIIAPHKFSLAMVSGTPVVVASDSNVADLVKQYNLGIIIDELDQLDEKMREVTPEKYQEFKRNVINMGNEIRNGEFTKNAIRKLMTPYSANAATLSNNLEERLY